jgi:hypothetical protein
MAKAEASQVKKEEVVNTSPEVKRETRRIRTPFNGTRGKLSVNADALVAAGYHCHIFNDEPGRIQTAIDGGYEFVNPSEIGELPDNVVSRNTDVTDKVRFLVGTGKDGEPMYAYLMKIRKEWWEEDQAALQGRNDAVESAIKRGKPMGVNSDGFYDAGIQMSNKKG